MTFLLSGFIIGVVLLFMLSLIVIIHELGHFLVAKKLGIKVEEFSFGFPPRLWGKKVGETIYSINLLPIGGFVKLFGEDEAGGGKLSVKNEPITNNDRERAFFARPVGQRASVVVAGVVMNALLAIVIFYTFLSLSHFTTSLPLLGDPKFIFVHEEKKIDNTIIVDEIAPNSPAAKAGMVAPLQLITINNKKVTTADDVVQTVGKNKGKEILITWQELHSQRILTATVKPRVNPPKGEGSLGVRFGPFAIPTAVLSYNTVAERLLSGIVHPVNLLIYTFDTFGKLISISFQERSAAPISAGVAGPVGVASAVGQQLQLPTVRERILGLLNLGGLISISLAFFNVLPIPALDGGRLFFILFEAITKKKINPRIENYTHAIGMILLFALIAFVTYNDIARLITH